MGPRARESLERVSGRQLDTWPHSGEKRAGEGCGFRSTEQLLAEVQRKGGDVEYLYGEHMAPWDPTQHLGGGRSSPRSVPGPGLGTSALSWELPRSVPGGVGAYVGLIVPGKAGVTVECPGPLVAVSSSPGRFPEWGKRLPLLICLWRSHRNGVAGVGPHIETVLP